MLERILPSRIDNDFSGNRLALWIAIPLVLLKLVIAFNSTFFTQMVAQKADGIPLDTYAPAAAQAVITLFALSGLDELVIALIAVLVLFRYRALVPFLYLAMMAEFVVRRVILFAHPIVRVAGTATVHPVNIILPALMVLGLVASSLPSQRPTKAPAATSAKLAKD